MLHGTGRNRRLTTLLLDGAEGRGGTEGVLTLVLARMSKGHLVKKVCMQRL